MFVGRNPDGTIYGLWTCPQPDDKNHQNIEELSDDHPDVVTFLNQPKAKSDKQSKLEVLLASANVQQEVKDYLAL